jgi:hypothetical protein
MQFARLLFTLCAAAIGATALTAHADDNAAQAAARAAVLQTLQGTNGTTDTNLPVAAPSAVAPVVIPAAPAPAAPVAMPVAVDNAAPSSADNAAQTAARAAVLQKLQELSGAGTSTPMAASAPVMVQPVATIPVTAPTVTVVPVTTSAPAAVVYKPIVGPALPISADQQTRLQALDAKYNANQISPLDYFNQREAIINGQ